MARTLVAGLLCGRQATTNKMSTNIINTINELNKLARTMEKIQSRRRDLTGVWRSCNPGSYAEGKVTVYRVRPHKVRAFRRGGYVAVRING